jgi:uncharacterized protein (TIGR00730 family)
MKQIYHASVSDVIGCAYDNDNNLITQSASASASSNVSYSDAYKLAYNLALQTANNLADSLANISNIYINNNNNVKIKVGVFCSASQLLTPEYYDQLNYIFKNLSNEKYEIAYGGGENGIMGQVARSAISNNLTLYAYDSCQFNDNQYPEAIVKIYDSYIPRENAFINNTDIALVLPGQYGTIMELFWIATINNVNQTKTKIIIWNINEYYTKLIDFLQSEQFQRGNPTESLVYNRIIVCNTYEEVFFNLNN